MKLSPACPSIVLLCLRQLAAYACLCGRCTSYFRKSYSPAADSCPLLSSKKSLALCGSCSVGQLDDLCAEVAGSMTPSKAGLSKWEAQGFSNRRSGGAVGQLEVCTIIVEGSQRRAEERWEAFFRVLCSQPSASTHRRISKQLAHAAWLKQRIVPSRAGVVPSSISLQAARVPIA